MPRYPETQALAEQALRHVLSEQKKLLQHPAVDELNDPLQRLNQLAINTSQALAEGFKPGLTTTHLTATAKEIERVVDDLSESLWTPLFVSVEAIYYRLEKSLKRKNGKQGFAADVRAHYHNLRLGLLEQMIGARMLASNSDLGDEVERIWQQFLERHLGSNFQVLRGGHICDHEGNMSSQIDVIVVPSDAHVFTPGAAEGGKVQVLIDQVISVIEITANLTAEKLKKDWRKLQSLPRFRDLKDDYPHLDRHRWPLCFIVAAHSDSADCLEKAWCECCGEGLTEMVPQFVIASDSAYLYSGARNWPAPQFPTNYIEVDHVNVEDGVYAGLALGWLIAQHQGRLAAVKGQALGPISRLAKLLDHAMLREAVPSSYSPRFETMFQMEQIAGVFGWGRYACFAHNRLQLRSVRRNRADPNVVSEEELFQVGAETDSFTDARRWFRYGVTSIVGNLLAIEEWINPKSRMNHCWRIAVFDTVSGEEITGQEVDKLKSVADLEKLKNTPHT